MMVYSPTLTSARWTTTDAEGWDGQILSHLGQRWPDPMVKTTSAEHFGIPIKIRPGFGRVGART